MRRKLFHSAILTQMTSNHEVKTQNIKPESSINYSKDWIGLKRKVKSF